MCLNIERPQFIQVFTDSQYVKDNMIRAREWKKNNWRNQHGEPRENADLWNQLISAHSKAGITVHFEWTLGKKSPLLKRVDKVLIERVRSGMARARAEGRQIGRARLDVNREQVTQDRRSGMSLTQVAKKHGISRASVCRLMKEGNTNPDVAVPALAGNMPEQANAASGAL